jgi:hypothetical protein
MSTTQTDAAIALRRTKEEMADKVRKLLTQAEDPAATPEEAQTFTMKAQQLMTKYAIDLAMISDAADAHELVERGWDVPGPYASHKVTLINSVARANDCRVLYSDLGGGRKHVQVIGFPDDVEWVEVLSRSLDLQMASALLTARRDQPAGVHGRTFSVAFVQGFIAEVTRRLQDARRRAVRDASAAAGGSGDGGGGSSGPSVALVLAGKQARVEEEFTVRHPRTRTVYQQVRLRSWSGYNPGRVAGRQASLARDSLNGRRRLPA